MKAFISYNEDERKIEGIFDIIEQTQNYVKFSSNKNIIIIPPIIFAIAMVVNSFKRSGLI